MDGLKTVTNTAGNAAMVARSPLDATPDAIVASEKRGQTELCASDVLPRDMPTSLAMELGTMGVSFLGSVEGDELFQYAQLPVGWAKVPSSHDMWSDLVNEKGEVVAEMFYKAAFYDRKALMRPAYQAGRE